MGAGELMPSLPFINIERLPKITQIKNKIIYPQITQIHADFMNKKILGNQIQALRNRSQRQEKDLFIHR
jgi:hypothetical protein